MPGTASDFWPNSGTQNEWMTSFACRVSLTASFTGSTSRPALSGWSPSDGYSKLHANCCAVTPIRSGLSPASSFFASTTALTTEMAVTSTAGIAVHTISRPVCPCTGGPSASSSSGARNLSTQYTITAATIAKMPMQMTVVNQNVNTIRSISSEAESGSQGTRTATSVAAVPASTPYTTRRTIEPLRTAARLSEPEPELGAQALYLRPPATRG